MFRRRPAIADGEIGETNGYDLETIIFYRLRARRTENDDKRTRKNSIRISYLTKTFLFFYVLLPAGVLSPLSHAFRCSSGLAVSGVVVVETNGVCVGSGQGGPFRRSRSLPHLLGNNDSGVGNSLSDGPEIGGGGVGGSSLLLHRQHVQGGGGVVIAQLPGHCSKSQPIGLSALGDVRQLVTLKQHYYPEGGWGWVVAAVAVATHLLTHGLHLASGVFVQELVRKFGPGVVVPAGTVTTIYCKKIYYNY